MPKLIYYADPSNGQPGRGLTTRLDNGEVCTVTIARTGLLIKKGRFGFGRTLHKDENLRRVAATAAELHSHPLETALPVKLADPVLDAFAGFIWNCKSCQDVETTIRAVANGVRFDGPPPPSPLVAMVMEATKAVARAQRP